MPESTSWQRRSAPSSSRPSWLIYVSASRKFLPQTWREKNKFQETKFVFPNAPSIPITVNMGMRMPGWYNITELGDLADRNVDERGILQSKKVFHTLIDDEIKAGISPERIVLGGFSQGGAMSLVAGVTNPTKLGGIFGLSCYLLLQEKLQELVPAGSPNLTTPIFMGHGDADPLVRYEWGHKTSEKLKEWGWTVDFKTYKGLAHSASLQELNDLEQYLTKIIPDQGGDGQMV